mmetsp:Transcript_98343/g.194920  ORF Transcript_98343/g.194920 Transcript_98343/m.194920 type:complete len:420 (-) Transcript_98343:88-1347(-)
MSPMRPGPLLLLLLAVPDHGRLCRAGRVSVDFKDALQPEQAGDTVGVITQGPWSPVKKYPLAKTVAEMFNNLDTSATETDASAGSCEGRTLWVKVQDEAIGAGANAEVFEIRKQSSQGGTNKYALKVAFASKGVAGKKEVLAEADLLANIHNNYRLAEKGDQCPNVVPMYEKQPCVCDAKFKVCKVVEGAYVTIKMSGDLDKWIYKKGGKSKLLNSQCRERNGKDVWRQQLLTGLDCLHTYGKVAHQDLKADNVLYDGLNSADHCPNELYIADLGLSETLGKETGFFDPPDYLRSNHLVADVWEKGPNVLGIKVKTRVKYQKVYEDFARKVTGWREVGVPTSRMIFTPATFEYRERPGYVVSKLIDYCSLINLMHRDLGYGVLVPGYDTDETKSNLDCGMMGMERHKKTREEHFTGRDR